MKKYIIIFTLLVTTSLIALNSRSIARVVNKQGREVIHYTGSYALVIGVSDYTNGWPDLEAIPSELDKIKKTLKSKGFKVTPISNPNSKELSDAYENFIDKYGYDENNRLLFFYSGHGYSSNHGSKGYLVPSDAPNPNKDMKAFKRKSLNMSRLLFLSRKMEVKHALFLFDSCFSGTIFKTKALPKVPPYIQKSMSKPVRQFITAGSAGEEVPAKSTFTPMFSDAIKGEADLNKDGYVTGSELGMYLSTNVPKYKRQTPQYGKIGDYDLSRGDFIFITPTQKPIPRPKPTPQPNQNAETKLWNMIESQNTIQGYNFYLDSYKNGKYKQIAKYKLLLLQPKKREEQVIKKYSLTINQTPYDAKVYITNIKPRYKDGIQLTKGIYNIKVEKQGYYTKKQEINLYKDLELAIQLEKQKTNIPKKNLHKEKLDTPKKLLKKIKYLASNKSYQKLEKYFILRPRRLDEDIIEGIKMGHKGPSDDNGYSTNAIDILIDHTEMFETVSVLFHKEILSVLHKKSFRIPNHQYKSIIKVAENRKNLLMLKRKHSIVLLIKIKNEYRVFWWKEMVRLANSIAKEIDVNDDEQILKLVKKSIYKLFNRDKTVFDIFVDGGKMVPKYVIEKELKKSNVYSRNFSFVNKMRVSDIEKTIIVKKGKVKDVTCKDVNNKSLPCQELKVTLKNPNIMFEDGGTINVYKINNKLYWEPFGW